MAAALGKVGAGRRIEDAAAFVEQIRPTSTLVLGVALGFLVGYWLRRRV